MILVLLYSPRPSKFNHKVVPGSKVQQTSTAFHRKSVSAVWMTVASSRKNHNFLRVVSEVARCIHVMRASVYGAGECILACLSVPFTLLQQITTGFDNVETLLSLLKRGRLI